MERLSYYFFYSLFYFISILPDWAFYQISNLFYTVVYNVIGYRKSLVRKNLNLVFPNLNETEKKEIEKKFYKHFCDVLLESIRPLGRSVAWVYERIHFSNSDLINNLQKNHQLTILLAGHYGAWELTPTISKFSKWPVYPLYTPIRNSGIAHIIDEIRTKIGSQLVSRYEFAKHIRLRQKDNLGGLYIFINDQSPRLKDSGLWTSFLSQLVPVHHGAERISRIMDIPIVFMAISRKKRGYYKADFKLITHSPNQLPKNQITKIYIDFLERQIYKDPTQYLWTHNRFKHADSN